MGQPNTCDIHAQNYNVQVCWLLNLNSTRCLTPWSTYPKVPRAYHAKTCFQYSRSKCSWHVSNESFAVWIVLTQVCTLLINNLNWFNLNWKSRISWVGWQVFFSKGNKVHKKKKKHPYRIQESNDWPVISQFWLFMLTSISNSIVFL